MTRILAGAVLLLSTSLALAGPKPRPAARKSPPPITASNLCVFVQHTERVSARSFEDVQKRVQAALKAGARLYYQLSHGGMDRLVDIEIYEVRGTQVSHTLYTLREDETYGVRASLTNLGLTPHTTDSLACQLLEELRALRVGKPTRILQVLAVKDAKRSDFYYIADRKKFLEVYDDWKPYSLLPGPEVQVLSRGPESYYKSQMRSYYDPQSELAPLIEAELARLGVVLNKQGIPLKQ